MNEITMAAFSDELHSIIKEASVGGVLKDVGTRIAHSGIGRNISGAVSDLRTPIRSLKEGGKFMFSPGDSLLSKGNVALNVATTGLGVPVALAKEDPTGRGESRAKRLATFTGGTLGGVMTAKRGISGGIVGSLAGGMVGSGVGSVIDKVRKPKTAPTQVQNGVQG